METGHGAQVCAQGILPQPGKKKGIGLEIAFLSRVEIKCVRHMVAAKSAIPECARGLYTGVPTPSLSSFHHLLWSSWLSWAGVGVNNKTHPN